MIWRNPGHRDALYLTQLSSWGYTLSEVEQIVVDHENNRAATTPEQTGSGNDPEV